MADYILLILWSSLFIFGWSYATMYTPNYKSELLVHGVLQEQEVKQYEIYPTDTKKEIAWWFRYYTRNLPTFIKKPLITCPMCMSSIYGSTFYWAYVLNQPGRINGLTFCLWVATVVAVAGLNRIVKQIAHL